ncbi:MAG: ribokinase [Clostridiales bacterium]|nr:ribokinase [Clostridiales bacterium]
MTRVLNIGSLNIDKTYQIERFVQPKETIKALKYEEFCGGKGLNQSIALARAGAEVYHAGAVGHDGGALLNILNEAGVHTEYIEEMDTVSGHAVIQVDQASQNNIIIYGGANMCLNKEYIDGVLKDFSKGDILLLQNEVSNVAYAIDRARAKGMLIMLNPSPFEDELTEYPLDMIDFFLLNEVEGKLLAEASSADPELIVSLLKEKYPNAAFALTLGEDGSCFFDQKQMIRQEIYKVKAVDTTGAGDTFTGYFIAGMAAGLEMKQIMRQASAASAISVGRCGAAPSIPDMDEVKEMMNGRGSL